MIFDSDIYEPLMASVTSRVDVHTGGEPIVGVKALQFIENASNIVYETSIAGVFKMPVDGSHLVIFIIYPNDEKLYWYYTTETDVGCSLESSHMRYFEWEADEYVSFLLSECDGSAVYLKEWFLGSALYSTEELKT